MRDPADYELDPIIVEAAMARTLSSLFGRGSAAAPQKIAGYEVRDVLGRGAMGVVYLAHDERLDRSVALKLVDPGRRHEVEARAALVKEAQQIARVQHPNVVAVYEVGEHQGNTFIAMEYVAGPTLREWTRAAGRTRREILEVFLGAARGLAAIHEAGLLHRDFKASNVLVTADGVAKVADFGLARIVHDPTDAVAGESGDAVRSEVTTSVAGTPAYMAPEQFEGKATALSDQFAFGVALIEALVGAPPFGHRPSKSLGAKGLAERLGSLDRAHVPAWLRAVLGRAVEFEPEARWPDMRGLIGALSDDPARRRWRTLSIAGVAIVAGLAGAGWYAWADARQQRCSGAQARTDAVWGPEIRGRAQTAFIGTGVGYAEHAWERTADRLDAYAQAWREMYTDTCRATTVRGEQSPEVMDLRMACLRQAQVQLSSIATLLADADEPVVSRADELVDGLRSLDRCADVAALQDQVEPPRPQDAEAVDTARRHLAEARAQRVAGRPEPAASALEAARVAMADVDYGPVKTAWSLEYATYLGDVGRYAEAEAELRHTLQLAPRYRQWPAFFWAHVYLLAVVGNQLQEPERALTYADAARGLAAGDPAQLAKVDSTVGLVLNAAGRYEEAEAAHRRAVAAFEQVYTESDDYLATALNNLGAVLAARGKVTESDAAFARSLELRRAVLGDEHPRTLLSRTNLALSLMSHGEHARAEAELRAVLNSFEAAYGEDHPRVAQAHNDVGLALREQGRHAEAEAEYRRALAIREKRFGRKHAAIAESKVNLADVMLAQGRYEDAIASSREALEVWEPTLPPTHPHVAAARTTIANALAGLGQLEQAIAEHQAVLTIRKRALGPQHVDVAQSRVDLAGVLLAAGQADAARELAELAWTVLDDDQVRPQTRAEGAFTLARARAASADASAREQAPPLARRALELYAAAGTDASDRMKEIRVWLAESSRR